MLMRQNAQTLQAHDLSAVALTSEVSSLGYMWSGDELIVSVVCSTCRSPRQHKTTPAAQFIHKHVYVQTIK